MTHATDDSAISMVLEQIIENGFDGLDTAVSILINEAMRIERSRVIEAEPWQRTQSRKGYANGYKPKSVESSSPGEFHPQALQGRVEGWRGTRKPVSSPRLVKRSMRISRTTLFLLTSSEGL